MVDRINLILKVKNITPKQFAEEIGIQPSGMSHILSGRNRPSLDFVMKVVSRYPEIDIRWLTLGVGEMYVPTTPVVDSVAKPQKDSAYGNGAKVDMSRSQSVVAASTPSLSSDMGQQGYVAGGRLSQDNYMDRQRGVAPSTQSTMDMPDLFSDIDPVAEKKMPVQSAPTVVSNENETLFPHSDVDYEGRKVEDWDKNEATAKKDGNVVVESNAPEATTTEPNSDVERQLLPHQNGVDAIDKAGVEVERKENEMAPSRQNMPDDRRASGVAYPYMADGKGKKIVKVVILFDDHSFAEYYPEG